MIQTSFIDIPAKPAPRPRKTAAQRRAEDIAADELQCMGAQFLRSTDGVASFEIELTNGGRAIICENDAEAVLKFKWRRAGKTALTTTDPPLSIAQVVLGRQKGPRIWHRDGDGFNNRRENLLAPNHHTTLHRDRAEIRMPGMWSAWISLEDVGDVQSRRWILHPCPKFDLTYAIGRIPEIKAGQLLHNVIMGASGMIDHANRDGLDCTRSNMRLATRSQNSWNTRKRKNGMWPYKGIFKNKLRWGAKIGFKGKELWIGNFKTQEEAANAYDEKARELFGEFACVNFPREGEQSAI